MKIRKDDAPVFAGLVALALVEIIGGFLAVIHVNGMIP